MMNDRRAVDDRMTSRIVRDSYTGSDGSSSWIARCTAGMALDGSPCVRNTIAIVYWNAPIRLSLVGGTSGKYAMRGGAVASDVSRVFSTTPMIVYSGPLGSGLKR